MARDIHHAGDDSDGVRLDDVQEEADHADAILSGDYEAETTDSDPNEVGSRPDEDATCRFCKQVFETLSGERTHKCPERKRLVHWQDGEDVPVIQTRIHELGAHLKLWNPILFLTSF